MIDTAAFLTFCNRTLDGYEQAIGRLSDEQLNERPPIDGASSPFQLVIHAMSATRWWSAHIVCGQPSDRDRDSEFVASGTRSDLTAAIDDVRSMLGELAPEMATATEPANEGVTKKPLGREWTVGDALMHTYEELSQHLGHLEMTADLATGVTAG